MMLLVLKTAGLVTTEQEKEFRTKQDLWRSEKQKYDEEEARFKKQQEEDKKAADAAAATCGPRASLC